MKRRRWTYSRGARVKSPSGAAVVAYAAAQARSPVDFTRDLDAALNVIGVSGTEILRIGDALAWNWR